MTDSQPQIMMPPVNYGIQTVDTPQGKKVVVQFTHMCGVNHFVFDGNAALEFAGKLRAEAKAANTGLTIVRNQSAGGVVDLSAFQEDDDDGPAT